MNNLDHTPNLAPKNPISLKYRGESTKLAQLNIIIAIFPPTNNMNRFRKMVMVCYLNECLEWQQFFEAELVIVPKSKQGFDLKVSPLTCSSCSNSLYLRIGSPCCPCWRSSE